MDWYVMLLLYFLIFLLLVLIQLKSRKSSFQSIESFYPIPKKVVDEMKARPPLRILQLVLFSHSKEYDQMKALSSEFYKQQHVRTIYYSFSPNIEGDYQLKGDLLYFKGEETFLPGITDKTVRALSYIEPELDQYDYIVRANTSTIINYHLLIPYLTKNPLEYGSGFIFNLQWIDVPYGITDKTHWGTLYGSGTSIMFSSKLLKKLLQHKEAVPMEVIDDVAMGVWVKRVAPEVVPKCHLNYFYCTPEKKSDIASELNVANTIFYRNRCSEDRSADVKNMKIIIDKINKYHQ